MKPNAKAKDIMRTDVVFATGDMSVAELAGLLESNDVTGVPVVNAKAKVIGVVSETDIVAADVMKEIEGKEPPAYFKSGWEESDSAAESIDYEKLPPSEKNVEDIMTPWVVSVQEDTPVEDIAEKMVHDRVHRVLVMDGDGRLKGIVSSMDIVRLIAAGRPVKARKE